MRFLLGRTKISREGGQGTVELILTLFAFFTIFFMFVQMSLSYAVANYYQYVTFMAARAYHAGYLTEADQKAAAEKVLTQMISPGGKERFGAIAKGEGGTSDVTGATVGRSARVHFGDNQARDTAWEQGVTFAFRVKMYMAPLIPGVSSGSDSTVLLESQSWLGREPTEKECEGILDKRRARSGTSGLMLYDNGC